MTVDEFLFVLKKEHIFLTEHDGKLICHVKKGGNLSEEYRLFLKQNKKEILGKLKQRPVESVKTSYGLTPLQEGLLFHGLDNSWDSSLYCQQKCWKIAQNIDLQAFKKSWQLLFERHDVLRARFVWQHLDKPRQEILTEVELPWFEQSINNTEASLDAFLSHDWKKGFDLAQAPLVRLTLLTIDGKPTRFVFTHHHLILDGWSSAIVIQALERLYLECINQKKSDTDLSSPSHASFVAWIENQDPRLGQLFWEEHLSGLEEAGSWPFLINNGRDKRRQSDDQTSLFELGFSPVFSKMCVEFARKQGITVNSLMQFSWGLLLSIYSGSRDVLFGIVSSGRAVAIDDIDQLVGMCINTLPFRVTINPQLTVIEHLKRVHADSQKANVYGFFKLVDLRKYTALKPGEELFSSLFIFENYPGRKEARSETIPWNHRTIQEKTSFPITLQVFQESDQSLQLKLQLTNDRVASFNGQRLLQQYEGILKWLTQHGELSPYACDYLSKQERAQLLQWSEGAVKKRDKTVLAIYDANPYFKSNKILCEHHGLPLSFSLFEELTNRWANLLQNKYHVKPGQAVAFLVAEPSASVVLLFSILKLGAHYVPLHQDWPIARQQKAVADADVRLWISDNDAAVYRTSQPSFDRFSLVARASYEAERCHLANYSNVFKSGDIQADDLVYTIYTSGTTSVPKGASVYHSSVSNVIRWCEETTPVESDSQFLIVSSLSFDLTQKNILTPICLGAELHFLPKGQFDVRAIVDTIASKKITHLTCTPSVFRLIMDEAEGVHFPGLRTLRHVVFGGEKFQLPKLAAWRASGFCAANLHNSYGPTECTDIVTCFTLTPESVTLESAGELSIGTPVPNLHVYVLGRENCLEGIGVPGELCIGGMGVGSGYISDKELTRQRFIINPINGSERMYRTGDWGMWREDGLLHFIGRKDAQVKFHGHRIDLSEIEKTLNSQREIKQSAVLIQSYQGTEKIIAYVVPCATHESINRELLRARLLQELPQYMVPHVFIELSEIPLTHNGKLNRAVLPLLDNAAFELQEEFIAPETEVEQHLATIWAEVLSQPRIGINDNFFSLGGDSILSIQVVAKARALGLNVEAHNLFQYPTIYELAKIAHLGKVLAVDQGLASGSFSLSPPQAWFFNQQPANPSHFNQSFLFHLKKSVSMKHLQEAFQALVKHHDALRLRFQRRQQAQEVFFYEDQEKAFEPLLHLEKSTPGGKTIEAICNAYQDSLDIVQGPVMAAVFIEGPEPQGRRLFIAINHLVIDTVSWRILLEDLQSAIEQLARNNVISFPKKTSSYRDWVEGLQKAASTTLQKQLPYWKQLLNGFQPVPVEFNQDYFPRRHETELVHIKWTQEQTQKLLMQAHGAYNTRINDLLLTALSLAFWRWQHLKQFWFNLEGHGREPIAEGVDISRTLGWFTAFFPQKLTFNPDFDDDGDGFHYGEMIKSIKEQTRSVPNQGAGFGPLWCYGNDHGLTATCNVSFNYLGQLDNSFNEGKLLSLAADNKGIERSPNHRSLFQLDLNAAILDHQFTLRCRYSGKNYSSQSVQQFVQLFDQSLASLVAHCLSQPACLKTPSDFDQVKITQATIDKLSELGVLEAAFPLTPLQEGMLFHALSSPREDIYCTQVCMQFSAPDFNASVFKESWASVIKKYDVFRTRFVWQDVERPFQVVYAIPQLKWNELDWRAGDEIKKEECFNALLAKDRQQGFDFNQDGLYRMYLIQFSDNKFACVFTHHHLLLDGWSVSLLIDEVVKKYLHGNKPTAAVAPIAGYGEFVRAFYQTNKEECRQFWNEYLRGFEKTTRLGFANHILDIHKPMHSIFRLSESVDAELSDKCRQFAKSTRVSLSTLMEYVWAVLLYLYNGESDTVIGEVVSNRHLQGVTHTEQRIGLFIATLPKRISLNRHQSIEEALHDLNRLSQKLVKYSNISLKEIQQGTQLDSKAPLFSSLFAFENYPTSTAWMKHERFHLIEKKTYEKNNYPFTLFVIPKTEMELRFVCDADCFDKLAVERVSRQYNALLRVVTESSGSWSLDKLIHTFFEKSIVRPELPVKCFHDGMPKDIALSYHQERLRFIDQFETGTLYELAPNYHNIPIVMQFFSAFDNEKLQAAVWFLLEKHAVLRGTFAEVDGQTYFHIHSTQETFHRIKWTRHQASHLSSEALETSMIQAAQTPFDLDENRLRIDIGLQQEQQFLLVITVHHSLCDFWSTRVLADEIGRHYSQLLEENATPAMQFPDFSLWQRNASSEWIDSLLLYWRWQLPLPLHALQLPEDRSRPLVHTYTQAVIREEMPTDLIAGIHQAALDSGVSDEDVLLGSLLVVLARYANTNEVIIGRENDNRPGSEVCDTIGPLSNLTVIRSILDGGDELRHHFSKVKLTCELAALYSALPFDLLVNRLNPEKDMSRTALFDVLFKYIQLGVGEAKLPYRHHVNYIGYGKYDYLFFIKTESSGSTIDVIYNSDIYDEQSARQLLKHYIKVLSDLSRLLYERIEDIELLTDEEKRLQLDGWNCPDIPFPPTLTVVERFENMVRWYPHHIAARFGQNEITYAALNQSANQLSHYLKHCGLNENGLIGLIIPRSLDMLIVIMGVLKAGAAYLPLDPDAPARRNHYIIENSGVQYLITAFTDADSLPHTVEHVIDWNDLKDRLLAFSDANLGLTISSTDIAYCIYTSGTTGVPKGVTISHQNVIRLFLNDEPLFDFSAADRWLLFHSYQFDFSVWEIFGGLLYGGCVVIAARDDTLNPSQILTLIRDEAITIVNQTPTAFFSLSRAVASEDYPRLDTLRMVIFGGEKLDPRYLLEWVTHYPHMKMINMYGITETTVHVSYKEIQLEDIDLNRSNIGKAIPTTLMYVMDQQQNLLPLGVSGEICVGGAGVSRGYLGNAELTAERFVNHPYRNGERLYRSGDRGKLLPNGEMIYLGRNDNQVNIRGFRIELGEIENCLANIPGITQAFVFSDGSVLMTPKILAYYVADKPLRSEDVYTQLRGCLPSYMLPSYVMHVPKIPLTIQGKVDKLALPSPTSQRHDAHHSQPQSKMEMALAQVWKNVLSRDGIYLEDSFFDLGGDSILIIVAISKAREQGIYLTPKDFFTSSSLRELAQRASFTHRSIEVRPIPSGLLPLSPIQQWFFSRDLAHPNHFNQSVLLTSKSHLDAPLLQQALLELVTYHDALRSTFVRNKEGEWKQVYQSVAVTPDIQLAILKPNGSSGVWQEGELPLILANLQSSLDIQNGPVMRAALVPNGEDSGDLLFLLIHHLVVDTVSWHLIISDLERLYKAKKDGLAVDWPPRTSSFYDWVSALEIYRQSWSCKLQKYLWLSIVQSDKSLLTATEKNTRRYENTSECLLGFSQEVSQSLSKALAERVDISMDDILFTAVYSACQATLDDEFICYREGHGRVGDLLGVDLSRTVGWFTSLYPALSGAPVSDSHAHQSGALGNLQRWLQQKAIIPDEGIGYGLIRFGSDVMDIEPLQTYRIGINYLGRQEVVSNNTLFYRTAMARGLESSCQNHRFFDINVVGWLGMQGLELKITYDNNALKAASLPYFVEILREVVQDLCHAMERLPSYQKPSNQIFLGNPASFKPVLSWNENAGTIPLFLFPPLLGGAEIYMDLASHLGLNRPVYSLESYNLHSGHPHVSDLSELARFYSTVILAIMEDYQSHPAICLGGWSMGGLLAWEVAQQLSKKSIAIDKLYLMDTPVNLGNHSFKASGLAFERYLSQLMDIAQINSSLKEKFQKIYEAERTAIANYHIRPNDCDVVLFAAEESYDDLHKGWSKVARKVECHDFAGSHFDIMKEGNLEKIAAVINVNTLIHKD